MVNNTKSGSAVMEEVRSHVNQLQSDVDKVSKEIADRDAQLLDQLAVALKEQHESVSKTLDDRLGRLEVLFDKILKSATKETENPNSFSGANGAGVLGAPPIITQPVVPETSFRGMPENPEIRFGDTLGHNGGFRGETSGSRALYSTISLPKIDFPSFDGSDPSDWVMKCEYYFDIYQVPHIHKTRMAVINFTGEASAWYWHFRKSIDNPPWELLVDEVFNRFIQNAAQELLGEFKRLHQVNKV